MLMTFEQPINQLRNQLDYYRKPPLKQISISLAGQNVAVTALTPKKIPVDFSFCTAV